MRSQPRARPAQRQHGTPSGTPPGGQILMPSIFASPCFDLRGRWLVGTFVSLTSFYRQPAGRGITRFPHFSQTSKVRGRRSEVKKKKSPQETTRGLLFRSLISVLCSPRHAHPLLPRVVEAHRGDVE